MNFELLSRPKQVRPDSKTIYLYAPSAVTAEAGPKPGTPIIVLNVYKGSHYEETVLRVLEYEAYKEHINYFNCTRYRKIYKTPCNCELPTEEMPEYLKEKVHHVLLSDIGK